MDESGHYLRQGVTPIGKNNGNEGNDLSFRGIFDGNNKTISNLVISKSDVLDMGLFGYATQQGEEDKATIINVRIKNIQVTGGRNVGDLVGRAQGICAE